eukprot:scaffold511606_cov53-Prasinocladus_malaysianus.AAC.1
MFSTPATLDSPTRNLTERWTTHVDNMETCCNATLAYLMLPLMQEEVSATAEGFPGAFMHVLRRAGRMLLENSPEAHRAVLRLLAAFHCVVDCSFDAPDRLKHGRNRVPMPPNAYQKFTQDTMYRMLRSGLVGAPSLRLALWSLMKWPS